MLVAWRAALQPRIPSFVVATQRAIRRAIHKRSDAGACGTVVPPCCRPATPRTRQRFLGAPTACPLSTYHSVVYILRRRDAVRAAAHDYTTHDCRCDMMTVRHVVPFSARRCWVILCGTGLVGHSRRDDVVGRCDANGSDTGGRPCTHILTHRYMPFYSAANDTYDAWTDLFRGGGFLPLTPPLPLYTIYRHSFTTSTCLPPAATIPSARG